MAKSNGVRDTALSTPGLVRATCGIANREDRVPAQPGVELTLSIWRAFAPPRTLVLFDRASEHRMLDPESNLQQEVYSWQLREDPLAGIEDERVRLDLHERLHRLNVSKPPRERRLAVLEEFVTAAERALGSRQVEWSPSQSQASDHDESPQEINALMAFVLHLKWLLACFANCPSVSVSIR